MPVNVTCSITKCGSQTDAAGLKSKFEKKQMAAYVYCCGKLIPPPFKIALFKELK